MSLGIRADEIAEAYLGGGLYASFDGFQFELKANDKDRPTDRVYLEPYVLKAFVAFYKQMGFDFK